MFDRLRQEIEQRPRSEGIAPSEVMRLPDPLARILNGMLRKGPRSLSELAGEFDLSLPEMHGLGEWLVAKGIFTAETRAEGWGDRLPGPAGAHARAQGAA